MPAPTTVHVDSDGVAYRRIDNAAALARRVANGGFNVGRAIGHKAGEQTPCTTCGRDEHYQGTTCKACRDLAWHTAGTPAYMADVYGDRAADVWATADAHAALTAAARGQGMTHACPVADLAAV